MVASDSAEGEEVPCRIGEAPPEEVGLGRRERQIMDSIYRLGKASVAEVRGALSDPPSYSAVRTMLGLLEEKGHLHHRRDGLRYIYFPTLAPAAARGRALRHLVTTFFGGSAGDAATALLEMRDFGLSEEMRLRIEDEIRRAEREGR